MIDFYQWQQTKLEILAWRIIHKNVWTFSWCIIFNILFKKQTDINVYKNCTTIISSIKSVTVTTRVAMTNFRIDNSQQKLENSNEKLNYSKDDTFE